MTILLSVITDIIHLFKMVIIYDKLLGFNKRKFKYQNILKAMIILFCCLVSVYMVLGENIIIKVIAYITIITSLFLCTYKSKFSTIVVSTLWLLVVTSLFDNISQILVKIIYSLLHLPTNNFESVFASLLSLLFILLIVKIYKNTYSDIIRKMRFINMFFFTLLTIVDNMVVSAMWSTTVRDYISKRNWVLYIAFIGVILGIFIQLGAVILLFAQKNIYMEKSEITKKYLNAQKNHYEYLKNREIETKKFRHDLKSHMQMLSDLVIHKEYDRFDKYLKAMDIQIEHFGNIITVNNEIADAVINQYYEIATNQGLNMQINGLFPADCTIDAYDLCTIFSNILSNAVEASAKSIEKYIYLDCRYTEKHIVIILNNSYLNIGQFDNKEFKTLKEDENYHGFGLTNIKDSIKKYDGMLNIDITNNEFSLKIILNYAGRGINENSYNR